MRTEKYLQMVAHYLRGNTLSSFTTTKEAKELTTEEALEIVKIINWFTQTQERDNAYEELLICLLDTGRTPIVNIDFYRIIELVDEYGVEETVEYLEAVGAVQSIIF